MRHSIQVAALVSPCLGLAPGRRRFPPVASVEVELYGVPRLRAGAARVTVVGNSVGEDLAARGRACPNLAGPVILSGGRVHPAYRLSVNGERFVTEPATPLADGDTLLLLAADVGG
ncbi:MAG: MoaD/ThiS family protein [Isosphaeraceae bacterium]